MHFLKKKPAAAPAYRLKKALKKQQKKDPAGARAYIYNIILYFYMFLYKYKDKNQQNSKM